MERKLIYRKAAKEIIEEIGAMAPSKSDIATQIVIDEERGHYVLFSTGWKNNGRIYGPFVHINVTEDGKVWLQHDGTNLEIATLLEEKGIPKEDIVLAFHAPYTRAWTGYAVS